MNRRLLIALAIALPVAIFIPAKIAASWRPVAIGQFRGLIAPRATRVYAYDKTIFIENTLSSERPTRFDLATGRTSVSRGEGFTADGKTQWQWIKGATPQIEIERGQSAGVYDVPADVTVVSPLLVDLLDGPERVEFLSMNRYLRWDKTAPRPTRDVRFTGSFWDNVALTRDGETMVSAVPQRILLYSTRDGRVLKRHVVIDKNADYQEAAWVSRRGTYAGYEVHTRKSSVVRCDVFEVSNGRKLWSFSRDKSETTVLAPDEKSLAQERAALGLWQVHDLQSGAKLRTLPRVPNVVEGAFSPDGATLYSVAGGVLYRQRAR